MLRRLLLLFGLLFAAVGFAVTVDPALAAAIGFPPLPTVVVAGLAAAFALADVVARRDTDFRDETDDEDRNEVLEPRVEAPRPGEGIDARLREGAGIRNAGAGSTQFSDRLRAVTVRALADARGLSPEEAQRQLDEGTWTDDPTAAAFFADGVDAPATDVVTAIVSADPVYERQAQHVVRELQRITGIEGGDA